MGLSSSVNQLTDYLLISQHSIIIYKLTFKVPVTTAADDIFKHFYSLFSEKIRLDKS